MLGPPMARHVPQRLRWLFPLKAPDARKSCASAKIPRAGVRPSRLHDEPWADNRGFARPNCPARDLAEALHLLGRHVRFAARPRE